MERLSIERIWWQIIFLLTINNIGPIMLTRLINYAYIVLEKHKYFCSLPSRWSYVKTKPRIKSDLFLNKQSKSE